MNKKNNARGKKRLAVEKLLAEKGDAISNQVIATTLGNVSSAYVSQLRKNYRKPKVRKPVQVRAVKATVDSTRSRLRQTLQDVREAAELRQSEMSQIVETVDAWLETV